MKLLVFTILFVSISLVHPQEAVDYRLPAFVLPSHYEVLLTFRSTVFTGEWTKFDGTVIITLRVTENVSTIKLHSKNLRISGIYFTKVTLKDYNVDNVTDILTITTTSDLIKGTEYVMTIVYDADISTTEMLGVYRSPYKNAAGTVKYAIATQFQPTSARKAFPCFDEPSFKATFKLAFILPPNNIPMSNTVQQNFNEITPTILKYTFETTPVMSSYLLAFIISDFDCTDVSVVNNVVGKVCSRSDTSTLRAWTVETAPKILNTLNQFTQVDYNTSMSKLDYVAVPHFAVEAMENWGLSTYREKYILYDPEHSTNFDKQSLTAILTHEIAHQWFGNLVTCEWWSETFLNEGFADYLEYFAVHTMFPDWQLDKQFVVSNLQKVLGNDEGGFPALQTSVSSATEVLSKFNIISYAKGSSIFRMVEHIMGAENFKKGINHYLMSKKLGNARPEDLWESLQMYLDNDISKLPNQETLASVMNNWVKEPSYPLLKVTVHDGKATVQQINSDSQWFVPISYTTSVSVNSRSTEPQHWLTPNDSSIFDIPENADWILLNNEQTGYYRINYDDQTWNAIESALKNADFGGISEIDRAQIVDNIFNFAKDGVMSYSKMFKLLEFVADDTSYFTWVSTFNGFSYLLERTRTNPTLKESIENHLLSLITKVYESTPMLELDENDHIYTLKQVLTSTWACQLGHLKCMGMTHDLFYLYKMSGVRPPKNLRSNVYSTSLQESANQKENWDFLWQAYLDSDLDAEKLMLLKALASATNLKILRDFLDRTLLDDSQIRAHDRLIVFENVAANDNGKKIALEFFLDNAAIIFERYAATNTVVEILQILPNTISDSTDFQSLRNYIENHLSKEYAKEGAATLETAQKNLNWLAQYEKQLLDYYFPSTTTVSPITTTVSPITTTVSPITTTVSPITTTVSPITTTVSPITTTVSPITTTVSPITTTVSPITTTVSPITTTVSPITTTVSPITTTVSPITTTVSPITTTVSPITTTVSPITTTVSPIVSSSNAFEYSINLVAIGLLYLRIID